MPAGCWKFNGPQSRGPFFGHGTGMGGGAGSPGGAGGLHQWQPVRDPPAKATRTITRIRRIFFIATSLGIDLVTARDYTTGEEAQSKNDLIMSFPSLKSFGPFSP